MNIKEQIEKLVKSILADEALKKTFQTEPIKAVEQVLGVDLPDDIIESIIAGVKAQLTAEQLAGAAKLLKKLF